jgi:hypothetical protein
MEQFQDLLIRQQFDEISIISVIFNSIGCMALVMVVAWFYKKYSVSLGGKTHVGSVLPLIGITVFLVITVVKSSLALSLGLVGALSIVRFRTPIKEPEELGFLFLTIAIGLGFGAGFQLVTIVVVIMILIFLFMARGQSGQNGTKGEYTLILKVKIECYRDVVKILNSELTAFKTLRLETIDEYFEVFISASIPDNFDASLLISKIKGCDSESELQFIESGVNW